MGESRGEGATSLSEEVYIGEVGVEAEIVDAVSEVVVVGCWRL